MVEGVKQIYEAAQIGQNAGDALGTKNPFSTATPLDGDTVKCKFCKRSGTESFVIQGDDSRNHVNPTNENVPDEKDN